MSIITNFLIGQRRWIGLAGGLALAVIGVRSLLIRPAVGSAMIAATQRLPKFIWKSLTWDQGIEMRNHAEITIVTGLEIYFCDPAKPWQRGSNENTNGLLHQSFPKGTDLSQHGPEHLDFVAAQMNRRPRETLGWLRRPAQALGRLFSTASEQPGVAPTD